MRTTSGEDLVNALSRWNLKNGGDDLGIGYNNEHEWNNNDDHAHDMYHQLINISV
ncbi:rCG35504 [Rattus norvegicus]|uniref:RCG35504 n=1 Tax=Rattus norvegicus TaxID=10116 RepID=A6HGK7_RAT|nr:rCG35504 [Rattus norvegicus]